MVHAGFEKCLAVQLAPQADRAELLALGERLVGEVAGDFFGRKIDVGEDHDAGLRLLEHLRAPARFAAGVEPLAAMEAHLFERGDQMRERRAAGAVRVMIVIGPAEAEAILPLVLHARRRGCGFASSRARRRRTDRRPSRCRSRRPRRRTVWTRRRKPSSTSGKLRCAVAERFAMPRGRGDLLAANSVTMPNRS